MFNEDEDEDLFVNSMVAVQANIAYLCDPKCPHGFGIDGWKNIVLVNVADGRVKVSNRVLIVMANLGIYLDKVARTTVDRVPTNSNCSIQNSDELELSFGFVRRGSNTFCSVLLTNII
jgi:hypothetical protein